MILNDTARLICRKVFAAVQRDNDDEVRREFNRLTRPEVEQLAADSLVVHAMATAEVAERKRRALRVGAEELAAPNDAP